MQAAEKLLEECPEVDREHTEDFDDSVRYVENPFRRKTASEVYLEIITRLMPFM